MNAQISRVITGTVYRLSKLPIRFILTLQPKKKGASQKHRANLFSKVL